MEGAKVSDLYFSLIPFSPLSAFFSPSPSPSFSLPSSTRPGFFRLYADEIDWRKSSARPFPFVFFPRQPRVGTRQFRHGKAFLYFPSRLHVTAASSLRRTNGPFLKLRFLPPPFPGILKVSLFRPSLFCFPFIFFIWWLRSPSIRVS